jgi:nicotinate dehydrogenase subunit B
VEVKRITCAQDMGIVISPKGATMQIEGCIMMGLGYTLSEDIRFKGGQILTTNFDTYELPAFHGCLKLKPFWSKTMSYPRRVAANLRSSRST